MRKPDLLVFACNVEHRLTSETPGAYVHSVAKPLRIFWALAGAHEASERIQAPLQSNLIAMNSQAEEVKEWFYYTASSKADAEEQHGRLATLYFDACPLSFDTLAPITYLRCLQIFEQNFMYGESSNRYVNLKFMCFCLGMLRSS